MTRVTVLAALSCLLHVAIVYGQESRGVIYDFTATWCGPCQQVAPVVEKLQREGLPIVKVDVDQHPEMQSKFGVQSIPTFILVIDGKEVDRTTGRLGESELRRLAARIPARTPGNGQVSPSQSRPGLIPIDLGSPAPLVRPSPAPAVQPAVEETRVAETEPKRSTTLRDLLPFGRKDKTEEKPEVVRGNDSVVENSRQGAVATQAENVVVDPMKASVRIRVITNGRIDLGSGTVISSQPGISQILTCAHIFNGFNDDSRIEVDVFENGRPSQFLARLVKFDKESDLGLISIPTTSLVNTAKVATVANNPKVSDEVAAIGCSGGDEPTRQQARITDIDKYEGPHNLLCTGVPVRGRSGGGLFNRQGEIVGVCSAADEKDQRGFYSGLLAMHKLLDQCSLSHLYAVPAETAIAANETPASREFPAAAPAGKENASSLFGELQPFSTTAPADKPQTVAASEGTPPAAAGVAATPVDVQSGNAEVVVIVRDRTNPAQNRVVILHQASPKFMSYLNGELPEGGVIDENLLGASQMENVPGVRRHERTAPVEVTPAVVSKSAPAASTTKETLLPTTISQPVVPRKYSRSGNQSQVAQ